MMFKLVGSSSLIALVSIIISLMFLFFYQDSSSFAKFAILQINQAYCITLNYSLFYLPVFSDSKNNKLSLRKSMLSLCLIINITYAFLVFLFYFANIDNSISSLLCCFYVFCIGIRAGLRNITLLRCDIKAISIADFIFSVASMLSLIISFVFFNFKFISVVLALIVGCTLSIIYLFYNLGAFYFRVYRVSSCKSYFLIIRKSGLINLITSVISDLNSNFYAYFLPASKGHESIVLPSFLVMCFRPFNLAMTSKEEFLRGKVSTGKGFNYFNYVSSFIKFSLILLSVNFFSILIFFTILKDYIPVKLEYAYGFENHINFIIALFLIFFLRVFKQALVIYSQTLNLNGHILIAFIIPFLSVYFVFSKGLLVLSIETALNSMIFIEVFACVFLFCVIWRRRGVFIK